MTTLTYSHTVDIYMTSSGSFRPYCVTQRRYSVATQFKGLGLEPKRLSQSQSHVTSPNPLVLVKPPKLMNIKYCFGGVWIKIDRIGAL